MSRRPVRGSGPGGILFQEPSTPDYVKLLNALKEAKIIDVTTDDGSSGDQLRACRYIDTELAADDHAISTYWIRKRYE